MAILENKPERAELVTEWKNMLGHQLPILPPFEQFWEELPDMFEWLRSLVPKVVHKSIPSLLEIDTDWQPPSMAHAWHTAVPFETIRFAAANRLCVNLHYHGTLRLIEPYSLRRTKEGNFLLHAVKHNTGESRSYRIDRIESAKITKIPFKPKYIIELTPSGPISTPPTSIKTRSSSSYNAKRYKPLKRKLEGRSISGQPTYFIQCTACGKRFKRKRYQTQLNPHKNKEGYPCACRIGYIADVKH